LAKDCEKVPRTSETCWLSPVKLRQKRPVAALDRRQDQNRVPWAFVEGSDRFGCRNQYA
jgi:hypothetical protein